MNSGAPCAIALLFLLIALSHAQRLGQWRNLSKGGKLSSLVNRRWAFNHKVNLKFCARRTIRVRLDGRKDYTGIINSKLRAVRNMGGGTVKLDAGVYAFSRNIWIPSYCCLVGSGMGRTTLKLRDYSRAWKYSGSVRSMHTERVTIMHMTIHGNRYRQKTGTKNSYGRYGMFSELTNYLYMTRVRVTHHAGYGFDPHGSKKHWSYYLIIDDCRADNNGLDGFTIDQTVHATISRGIATKNDRHGFNVVTGTQLAYFVDNTSNNNGKASGVGYGYIAQNNQGYGTGRLTFRKCGGTNNHRGWMKLRDVYQVYVEDSVYKSTLGNSAVCYELAKTRRVVLQRNRCVGIRKSRQFKLRAPNSYRHSGDRSVFAAGGRGKTVAPPVGGKDPTCRAGIKFKDICCAKGCKFCGRRGCGMKANGGGASFCCRSGIKASARPCSRFPAPCSL